MEREEGNIEAYFFDVFILHARSSIDPLHVDSAKFLFRLRDTVLAVYHVMKLLKVTSLTAHSII